MTESPYSDSLSLRLPTFIVVNLATPNNSPAHYAKGTRSGIPRPKPGHSPPTTCRYTVSGTISLPSQGFFSPFPHGTGSLSVAKEYLALGSGLPGFPQGFSCPVVLRNSAKRASRRFVYRAITVYGRSFQIVQLQQRFVTLRGVCGLHRQSPATPDP